MSPFACPNSISGKLAIKAGTTMSVKEEAIKFLAPCNKTHPNRLNMVHCPADGHQSSDQLDLHPTDRHRRARAALCR
jgi:hypothetical protein